MTEPKHGLDTDNDKGWKNEMKELVEMKDYRLTPDLHKY